MHNAHTSMKSRPADECPYPRPFPPGFRDCPAYRSARLVPLDSRHRPLRAERTCQHLEVGNAGQAGRFYARCAVGTAADRARWADPGRERALSDAQAITDAMEERTAALVDRLWAAKGRQMAAAEERDALGRDRAVGEQQAVVAEFMRAVEVVLTEQGDRLARLDLPMGTTLEFLRTLLDQFVAQAGAGTPDIPDEWVERFPEQAWWLLRPRAATR